MESSAHPLSDLHQLYHERPLSMDTFIHSIETAVPEYRFSQAYARDRLKEQFAERRARKIIHHVYDASGIETRHSVVDDWGSKSPDALFRTGAAGRWLEPGTEERNKVFAQASRRMSVDLVRRLLQGCSHFAASDVTHLITVSCTGFYNPGPDFYIVQQLELDPSVERYHLGFMGCYAVLPALRMARQFCEADPDAVVLVVSVELCSLHLQMDAEDVESLVAGSLFSDGAAAALVSARPPTPGHAAFRLQHFGSTLLPDGEHDMAWTLGNRGFRMSLSSYVPDLLGANIQPVVGALLQSQGSAICDVDNWAIHPGGKSILDKASDALQLGPDQLAVSRDVLRRYGNMSSATVLFVLERFMRQMRDDGGDQATLALAFGPGLTVESSLMILVRAPIPAPAPGHATDLALRLTPP